MKRLLVFIGLFFLLVSCERDDLCLEKPSVSMNTVFVNSISGLRESVNLTVLYEQDTIIAPVTTDSLLIPLPVHEDHFQYVFVNQNGGIANPDTLVFQYRIDEQFISKACGFKTVFYDLQISLIADPDNWIKHVEILESRLTADTLNHVKIYH